MKPAPFRLHFPETIDDATALLADWGDDAKTIAGGQSLVPLLSMRLARVNHLVDINRVAALTEMSYSGDRVMVGAMVRQSDAERDSHLATSAPSVSRALPLIGHFQIRNRGTVGGSIAHADPASELPAVALAMETTMVVAGRAGSRIVERSGDDLRRTPRTDEQGG